MPPRSTTSGSGRGGVGKVDDAACVEGAPVVDADGDRTAVGRVAHARVRGDGQGGVRGGHAVHVVGFAARGFLSVELAAVPASDAAFAVGADFTQGGVIAAEHRIGPVGESMQGFLAWHRIRNDVEIVGRIVAGPIVEVVAAALGDRRRGFFRGRRLANRRHRRGHGRWRSAGTRGETQRGRHGEQADDHFCTSIRFRWMLMRMPMPRNRVTSAVPP